MFNRLSFRKKQGRGPSEDPAAPFLVSRSTGSAAKEMVDYALIDETVNEWMTDASRAKAEAQAAPGAEPSTESTVRPKHRSPVAGREAAPAVRRSITRMAGTKPLESKPLPHPVLHRADQKPLAPADVKRLDRVLQRAYAAHLMAPDALLPLLATHNDTPLDWRRVAQLFPDHAHTLGRLAADTYGFRSILICQMGTLVLADLLTMRVPAHIWRPMFENGLVPVVEHGATPDPNDRILCASRDPSSKAVREFLQGVKSFRPESVYADEGHIRAVMELIAQHIPAVGAQVRVVRPDVVRVAASTDTPGTRSSPRAA